MATETTTDIAATSTANPGVAYLEWGSIFGGIAIAGAISLVLGQFGAAIGLSLGDPMLSDGSASWNVLVAGLWLILVAIASASGGGYLSGRMRARREDAVEAEVEVRDGTHGLVVWAGATLMVAAVTGLSAGLSAIAGAMIVDTGTVTEAASDTIARLASNSSVIFAFATAAGAALAAAAAWFAGTIGGAHRDAGLSIHEIVPAALRKRA